MKISKLTSTCMHRLVDISLGITYSASLTILLAFYPFYQTKLLSISMIPIVMGSCYLLDKYAKCSVVMTSALLNVYRRKTSLLTFISVYSGMLFGAYYACSFFRIQQGSKSSDISNELFQEKMFISLNETMDSRLQQTGVITMLFYFTTNAALWVKIIFYFLSIVWIPSLPDMNPAIAFGWFKTSPNFDGPQLAQFWVNAIFLSLVCLLLVHCAFWILNIFKYFKAKEIKFRKKL